MSSLESHNWKLSVHRQDSSHSIASERLERVKRGWLVWDYLEEPCAEKYYTHQQSSLSDELTLSNLLFTLPERKYFQSECIKLPWQAIRQTIWHFLFQNSHCVVQFTQRHACQARLTWASLSTCKTVRMGDCRAALVVSGSEWGLRERKCVAI